MHAVLSILLVAWLGVLPAFGEPPAPALFIATTTPFYAAPDADARPIGKVLVAARLAALETDATGWTRVRVTGWTQGGAERVVQAAPGIRVTRAILAKDGLAALTFGETLEDPDTGLSWTRTALTGWIPRGADTLSDLDSLWARAEPLFATRCTACHERRVPERYTANQWTSHLKVMGPRTGLAKDDQALIRVYLQYQSADAAALAAALSEE